MSQQVFIELEVPTDLIKFQLPEGVEHRLQDLLDKQDQGKNLTKAERMEAEGLVALSEFLSLLRLQAERAMRKG